VSAIVDFHCHLGPSEWRSSRPMMPALLTDAEGFLERKRALGVEKALVTNATFNLPGAPVDDLALDQIKQWNQFGYELAAGSDGMVVAGAGIDPFGGPAMLEELRRAVTDAGFRAVMVNSTVNGRRLGVPDELEDFWSLVEELGIPVLVHPPALPPGFESVTDRSVLEFGLRGVDVALSIASAVMAGVLERHPGVRLVAMAGGGGVSMLVMRLDIPYTDPPPPAGPPGSGASPPPLPRPPSSYLANVYVDTCSFKTATIAFDADLLGSEHVLFGTDSPPLLAPFETAIDPVRALDLDEQARADILGGNALRILGIT
jgi:predicted TIM-barrel fold metal-dependent hydrolase